MKILVVDRNRRVGEFLKRELEKDSHSVDLTDTGSGLMGYLKTASSFELLVIDPDLPDMESNTLFQIIVDRMPGIAIIIHTYLSDFKFEVKNLAIWAQVEKKGNSIDSIRNTIKQLPNFSVS